MTKLGHFFKSSFLCFSILDSFSSELIYIITYNGNYATKDTNIPSHVFSSSSLHLNPRSSEIRRSSFNEGFVTGGFCSMTGLVLNQIL